MTPPGVPTDVLDAYPSIRAHHEMVASLPSVKANYAGITEGLRLAFKPKA